MCDRRVCFSCNLIVDAMKVRRRNFHICDENGDDEDYECTQTEETRPSTQPSGGLRLVNPKPESYQLYFQLMRKRNAGSIALTKSS